MKRIPSIRTLARALRVHQWAKNLLLFIPLIAAHRLSDGPAVGKTLIAFFVFCLVASAMYLVNDIMDLEADRRHPKKRHRPLASGALSPQLVQWFVPALLIPALLIAWRLEPRFLIMIFVYLFVTTLYSVWLKQKVMIDVLCLAGLYTIRILAGGMASGILISQWLMAFSMFLFLSLGMLKRYSELLGQKLENRASSGRRAYSVTDLEMMASFGAASACLAVLVLALYIQSPDVRMFYRFPDRLWFVCPFLLYWVSRTWILGHRGQVQEDPVVFALKDKASYFTGLVIAGVLWAAT